MDSISQKISDRIRTDSVAMCSRTRRITIVIAVKETCEFVDIHDLCHTNIGNVSGTSTRDMVNDNLFFSCYCGHGGLFGWLAKSV
jgi:putative lipase involved disintegration of autophagic bodies